MPWRAGTAVSAVAALIAACAVLLAAHLPAARADPPVGGGRFVAAQTLGAGSASVVLTLADDGRELARPSRIRLREPCSPTEDLLDVFVLDARASPTSRPMAVRADGRFSHRLAPRGGSRRSLTLVGRFADRGRTAEGTARIREDAPCPDATVRFRARLAGRPNAPRPGRWAPCDDLVAGWFDYPSDVAGTIVGVRLANAYGVWHRDGGCTAARELARRWDRSLRCRDLLPGVGSCRVRGARCTAAHGGVASPLASAACTEVDGARGRVELVHRQPCVPPPTAASALGAWAINAECDAASAFPIDDLLPDAAGRGPCGALGRRGPLRCAPVAGYRCTGGVAAVGPPPAFAVLCVVLADPAQALRFASAPAQPSSVAHNRLRMRVQHWANPHAHGTLSELWTMTNGESSPPRPSAGTPAHRRTSNSFWSTRSGTRSARRRSRR